MLADVAVTLVGFGVLRQRTRDVAELLLASWADQVNRVVEHVDRVASVLRRGWALPHPAVLISRASRIHPGRVGADYLMRVVSTHRTVVLLSLRRAAH